jgi:hypothetical protein
MGPDLPFPETAREVRVPRPEKLLKKSFSRHSHESGIYMKLKKLDSRVHGNEIN